MGLDDYVNPETGLMSAATAAAVSPRARELLRRGAVYGLAGVMRAGDVVSAAARGAVRGARESVAQEDGRAPTGQSRARSGQSGSTRSTGTSRSTRSSSGARRSTRSSGSPRRATRSSGGTRRSTRSSSGAGRSGGSQSGGAQQSSS